MSHKGLHVRTFGCQMNVYDSARMVDLLAPHGYTPVDTPEAADMVVLNTCHIREKASEKVFSELGRLRQLKASKRAAGGDMVLAVAGCVAQAQGEELMNRAPWVDLVVGPQSYHRLPELIAQAARGGRGVMDADFPAEPKFDHLPDTTEGQGASAFLAIQEGCDKFCTFCVVPYTRGAEYSRPVDAILAEARRLADTGAREITLIGQNVNAYHGTGPDHGTWTLGHLIRAVADVEGVERVRYTTSHPKDVDDTLVAAHAEVPALVPFLHLAVQSGSDRVLHAMNRGHTADTFRDVARRLKEARPDLQLSSDFIVGFPGETEADFEATMALIRDVGFLQACSFKFSARPGTPAAALTDDVPDATKTERLHRLQTLLAEQQRGFNESCVGTVQPVLFDRPGRHDGQLAGRSPWMQPVHAALPETALGRVVPVRIREALPNSLAGEPVEAPSPAPRTTSLRTCA